VYMAAKAARAEDVRIEQAQRRDVIWSLQPTVMPYSSCVVSVERDMMRASSMGLDPWVTSAGSPALPKCANVNCSMVASRGQFCLLCYVRDHCDAREDVESIDIDDHLRVGMQRMDARDCKLELLCLQTAKPVVTLAGSTSGVDKTVADALRLLHDWHRTLRSHSGTGAFTQGSGAWLARRQMSITGTKIHSVMVGKQGMWTVVRTLLGLQEPVVFDSQEMARGRLQEPIELDRYAQEHGVTVESAGILTDATRPFLMSSPDGLVRLDGVVTTVLEVKSSISVTVKPAWRSQLALNMALAQSPKGVLIHHNPVTNLRVAHQYDRDIAWETDMYTVVDRIARDYLLWYWQEPEPDWVRGEKAIRSLLLELGKDVTARTDYRRVIDLAEVPPSL